MRSVVNNEKSAGFSVMKTGNEDGVPFRPARHAKHRLIAAILDGTYPRGAGLPSERVLAEQLGVTRPTVREALHRLEAEGWITIRHGRSTTVNNYWETGGLALLGTLVSHSDLVPGSLIMHLLDFRVVMLPPVARAAADTSPGDLQGFLAQRSLLSEAGPEFAEYDWRLQARMARLSQNPVYHMILNDFHAIFDYMARFYFSHQQARNASMRFYDELDSAIKKGGDSVERVVRKAMEQSIVIWKQIIPSNMESSDEAMERLGR
ncbi:MAG: GntR family transcriptional regulator [Desulfobacterales bacterium]